MVQASRNQGKTRLRMEQILRTALSYNESENGRSLASRCAVSQQKMPTVAKG